MEDPIYEEEYKGYKIRIVHDDLTDSPREWDNLGTMICFHSRYILGDKHDYLSVEELYKDLATDIDPTIENRLEYWDSGNGWSMLANRMDKEGLTLDQAEQIVNEKQEAIIEKVLDENVLMLPLYLYDHSGVTMNTTGFHCSWDSGQVGYIYVTKEQIRKEFGISRVHQRHWNKAIEILIGEVESYDQYLRGEVYGYLIDSADGESNLESCFGFYGNYEVSCLPEARAEIDAMIKHDS